MCVAIILLFWPTKDNWTVDLGIKKLRIFNILVCTIIISRCKRYNNIVLFGKLSFLLHGEIIVVEVGVGEVGVGEAGVGEVSGWGS